MAPESTNCSHRLVGDDNAAHSQQQLNVPQAEDEHMVQRNGAADYFCREAMSVVWVGVLLPAASLVRLGECGQTQSP